MGFDRVRGWEYDSEGERLYRGVMRLESTKSKVCTQEEDSGE